MKTCGTEIYSGLKLRSLSLCRDTSNPFGNPETCNTQMAAYISFGQWVGLEILIYNYCWFGHCQMGTFFLLVYWHKGISSKSGPVYICLRIKEFLKDINCTYFYELLLGFSCLLQSII